MEGWLEGGRGTLIQSTLKTLRENVAHNRSGLPPFRLPQVAQELISGLFDFAEHGSEDVVKAAGQSLGRVGLGLQSIAAVGRTLVRESLVLLRGAPLIDAAERAAMVQEYASLLMEGVAACEMKEVTEQRDEMQALLEHAMQSREIELRKVIQDLSTPIMPVHEHILVLPLVGGIDDERAHRITERLLAAVSERRARTVIIDVTGVVEFHIEVADGLLRAAKAVQLLGTTVVLVGISPDLARTLIEHGVTLGGLVTLANLQSGIEHALREQGLGVYEARSPSLERGRRASRS
jgi:rsbT co-antagonist protein RsbR